MSTISCTSASLPIATDGHRDLVLHHAAQQAGEVAAGHLAVGQEDDVLEQRRPLEELR
jgi:hypothetical protein